MYALYVSKISRRIAAVAVALGMLFGAVPASATLLTSTLNINFGTGSAGSQTLDVTFDDSDGTGVILMTIDTSNLNADAKILTFYFNFDDALDSANLVFQNQLGTADDILTPSDITNSIDCCQADGDGKFDVAFNWGGSDEFLGSDTFSIEIVLTGITVADFDFTSTTGGGQGIYCAAAHVGNVDAAGDSDHLGGTCNGDMMETPEPATLLLFGFGLLGLGAFARRQRRFTA